MMNIITEYLNPRKHEIYFDNFFLNYNLLLNLSAENIKATGTVREIEPKEQIRN